jgi:hypothetical protein
VLPLVAGYVATALAAAEVAARQVRVTETGEMFNRPGGRPMRFTATERFAVDRMAFAWGSATPRRYWRGWPGPGCSARTRDLAEHGLSERRYERSGT